MIDPKARAAEACLSQRVPQPQWRWSQGHSALRWTWEWRKVPKEGLREEMNQTGLVGLSEWVAGGPGRGRGRLPSGRMLVPRLVSRPVCAWEGEEALQPPWLCPTGPKLLPSLGPGLCLRGWPQQALGVFAEDSPMGLPGGSPGTEFPSGNPLGFLRPAGGSECNRPQGWLA